MNKKQLHVLQHALGVDSYGQGDMYRSHFVTSPDTTDWEICMQLTDKNLMECRAPSELTGGSYCFLVTEKGKLAMLKHSPLPPPPPKYTRSQKRYQNYLHSECSESFGEWLKHGMYKYYEQLNYEQLNYQY